MNIKQLEDNQEDMEGFNLVELRDDTNIGRLTPHCKKHGAMNSFPLDKKGRKIWRCLSEYGYEEQKGETMPKFRDRTCKACCIEI